VLLHQQPPEKGATRRLFYRLLFIACVGLAPLSASADSCPATQADTSGPALKVKYVHDGDTLVLRDGRKVRLIGIDTPELARKQQPAQPYAIAARDRLRQLVADSNATIRLQIGNEPHDRYRRLLAHVFDTRGNNLNASMIQHGLAIAFTTPPNTGWSDCYHQLDRSAMSEQTSLWAQPRYRPVDSADILDTTTGFHRIRAHIDRVKKSSRGIWLMAGALGIHIRARDFKYFDLNRLHSLAGKTILIRGWLRKDRYKPGSRRYLALRHASAIESVQ
jgi:endonuclease YncB( thermonuclease family)